MAKLQFVTSDGQTITLDVLQTDGHYQVTVGETDSTSVITMQVVITRRDAQTVRGYAHIDSTTHAFYLYQPATKDAAVNDHSKIQLWWGGYTLWLERVNPQARRGDSSAKAQAASDIKAPMPGTVLKIAVKPGDSIEAGQPVVIMESMKMEMSLTAAGAATVEAIQCSEGQLVEMGAVLVKLQPVSVELCAAEK